MAYEINICNQALGLLGDDRITSFEDGSKEARYCSLFFEQAANEVLHKSKFREAVHRVALTQDAEAPLNQWLYSYQLPQDFIRVLRINESDLYNDSRNFEIEGTKLLINDAEVNLKYVRKLTDFSSASPLLVKAIAYTLAAKICHALTGSASLMGSLEQQAEAVIFDANFRQAKESRSGENSRKRRDQERAGLIVARRSGTVDTTFEDDAKLPLNPQDVLEVDPVVTYETARDS